MNLDIRFKIYVVLSLLFCSTGVIFNMLTNNVTGLGALFIVAGGISLVLGITIKRKAQALKSPANQNQSNQEK